MAITSGGPLSHLRVLDLSRVLAGPWAGQILGDLGADVIKVERPGTGDDTRAWGPPYLKDTDGADQEAAYYLGANRNKRSIAVDLSHAEGQKIIRKLAAQSDVVIENFKVGGLAKYGLDYPSLSKDHPGLIYCSITGFGQDGPSAKQAGYDFIVQGLSGLMSITGEADGPPIKVGTAVADLTTAMYGVIGILAALSHREKTGEGQYVDMALLDTQMSWLANQNMNYLIGGESPKRVGNAHLNIVPYQDFETQDGRVIVCVGNDRQFQRFCEAIGAPELARNRSYETNALRVRHRDVLVPAIAARMRLHTTARWLEILSHVNIPHGPINSVGEAFADPQAVHRGMRVDMDHPLGVSVPTVANPIHLSKTPVSYRRPPPLLGEHGDEILDELGIDPEDRARLKDSGAIG
ncbi:CoA transferase [Iodidimonas muriae]|uniref:CoA transferase n=1 Tax=Iodidimonas muriae TaxID=261467 RepID=A0ABQ2LFW5_9PROT|nr:CaiB/BaiF CoA-transferase family protein [Iodidimonas muriae]GER08626.1 CoA transferase [Kordiimonadales bacterium JCM 17843]GGO15766.1 CoA transferase [Iodidimonas muriae]